MTNVKHDFCAIASRVDSLIIYYKHTIPFFFAPVAQCRWGKMVDPVKEKLLDTVYEPFFLSKSGPKLDNP